MTKLSAREKDIMKLRRQMRRWDIRNMHDDIIEQRLNNRIPQPTGEEREKLRKEETISLALFMIENTSFSSEYISIATGILIKKIEKWRALIKACENLYSDQ